MSNIRSGSQYIAVPGAAPDSKVTRDKITGDLHGVSAQVAEDLLSQRPLYQDSADFPLPTNGGGGDSGFIPTSSTPTGPSTPPTVAPGPAFDLINSIQELQGLEEYLFQQLQAVNLESPGDQAQQNDIINHINQLSDLRNDLFGQLGKIYVNLDKNSQVQRSALTDQITTANMMEQQMNNLKNDVQIILDERVNKMRMVEIGEYEYLRYSAHKTTMQIIAFTSLAILFFSYTLKKHILPPGLSKVGIIAAISIGGVLTVRAIWNMVTRDNQNYNRFKEPDTSEIITGEQQESVWQHDVNFFEKLWRGIKNEGRKEWGDLKNEWDQTGGKFVHQASMINKCYAQNPSGSYCYAPTYNYNGCVKKDSTQGLRCITNPGAWGL